MGKLLTIDSKTSCEGCPFISEIAGNLVCKEFVHTDSTPVTPVMNGERTSDWNFCDGERVALERGVQQFFGLSAHKTNSENRQIQIVDTAHGMHKRIGER